MMEYVAFGFFTTFGFVVMSYLWAKFNDFKMELQDKIDYEFYSEESSLEGNLPDIKGDFNGEIELMVVSENYNFSCIANVVATYDTYNSTYSSPAEASLKQIQKEISVVVYDEYGDVVNVDVSEYSDWFEELIHDHFNV